MASFICIPLKKTYELDLVKPLKDAMLSQSASDDASQLEAALNSLNNMRKVCTAKTLDIKHESSLEQLEL